MDLSSIIGILSLVLTGLTGAIGILWKWMLGAVNDLKKRTVECEEDREIIHGRLEAHGQELAVFKACAADPCPARDGLRRSQTFNLNPSKP